MSVIACGLAGQPVTSASDCCVVWNNTNPRGRVWCGALVDG